MESVGDVTDLLQRSLLVRGLSPEQVERIAAVGKRAMFRTGEHIFQMGACECDLYVLMDGRVVLLTQDSDKLGEVGAAGILGEISFIDAGPRHSHAVAMSDVVAVRFPAKELRSAICCDRTAGFIVLSNLARLLTFDFW